MIAKETEEQTRMMIISVNEVLKFIKTNPGYSDEDAIAHMIKKIKAEEKIKRIGLAATSLALKYKRRKYRVRDKDVFQFVLDKKSEIINSINS